MHAGAGVPAAAAAAAAAAMTLPPLTVACLLTQDARQNAAIALVDALVKDQREFEGDSGAELSEEEDEAEAAAVATAAAGGGTSAQDVARALRRCSPLMVRRRCRTALFATAMPSAVLPDQTDLDCAFTLHWPSWTTFA
jgi:hypothetical protein